MRERRMRQPDPRAPVRPGGRPCIAAAALLLGCGPIGESPLAQASLSFDPPDGSTARASGINTLTLNDPAHVVARLPDGAAGTRFRPGSHPRVASIQICGGGAGSKVDVAFSEPVTYASAGSEIVTLSAAGTPAPCPMSQAEGNSLVLSWRPARRGVQRRGVRRRRRHGRDGRSPGSRELDRRIVGRLRRDPGADLTRRPDV